MLSRLRRPAAMLLPALLLPGLAACDNGGGNGTASGPALRAVSFAGGVGKNLTATWHKPVEHPKSTTVTTLVKGDGRAIRTGDTVSAYLWIGNGTTKKVAYSDFRNGAPESIPVDSRLQGVFAKVIKGATYGSRVAAVTDTAGLFGSSTANSQLGIKAGDSLVVVADLVEQAPVSPDPSDGKAHDTAASKLPEVVVEKGEPTGFDWQGVAEPAPSTPVQRVVLRKGSGPKVTGSDTVTVNYLGETYKARSPFDESYSKQPYTASLDSLIKGWKVGLSGVRVGSRVLLQIPPAYGYGAEGSGSTIPGNATLWFVIDVVKASKG